MTPLLADSPRARTEDVCAEANPFRGLDRLLGGLESLLPLVPPGLYETSADGGIPMDQRVCRALDQIEPLVRSAATSVVSYERRGGASPLDRPSTLRRVRTLRTAMLRLPAVSSDHVLRVEQAFASGSPGPCWSTLDNEIAFAVSHLADAVAVIEQSMRARGCRLPEGFGSMDLDLPPLRARSSVPPSWSLLRVLGELETLIGDVDRDTYGARFASDVSGSIGEHVRHCLDHVGALLGADPSATLSYDHRHRGTAVETDPDHALEQIAKLKRAFGMWSTRPLDEPIRVRSMVSPSGDALTGWSTLARELAFVLSHTIHHQAIIGVLLAAHGCGVPERFGHSPSTPQRH